MWAMPSATFFFTFLRTRAAAVGATGGFAMYGILVCSAGLRGRSGNLDRGLARTLPRARVGAGTLAANRQPFAVTSAAIAAEVHQPLDIHRHLAAQVALHGKSCDLFAQTLHVGLRQVFDFRMLIDLGCNADRLRARAADAEDRLQRDLGMLVIRNVDSRDAGHTLLRLFAERETRNYNVKSVR